MDTMKYMVVLAAVLMLASLGFAQEETTHLQNVLSTIMCVIIQLLIFIAGGIAIVIIVLNGIKWTASSDDPGARKQAKEGIIHAIVGLIIVLIAVTIVGVVIGAPNTGEVIITGC